MCSSDLWLLTGDRFTPARSVSPLSLPAQGLMVGLLTGIAGVGGGFAIVPALVLLAGLPMPLASGTSLLLIAVNALVAFAALGHWPAASLPPLLPLVLGGALGALVGQRLAPQISDRKAAPGICGCVAGLGPVHRCGSHQAPPADAHPRRSADEQVDRRPPPLSPNPEHGSAARRWSAPASRRRSAPAPSPEHPHSPKYTDGCGGSDHLQHTPAQAQLGEQRRRRHQQCPGIEAA